MFSLICSELCRVPFVDYRSEFGSQLYLFQINSNSISGSSSRSIANSSTSVWNQQQLLKYFKIDQIDATSNSNSNSNLNFNVDSDACAFFALLVTNTQQ
jgi:hypothetical protein